MKQNYIIRTFIIMLTSLSAISLSAQWATTNFAPPVELSGLWLKADTQIWVTGGNSTMQISEDCGTTWQPVDHGYGDDLGKILFVDDQLGFVLGDDGDIGRTTDGGSTWNFTSSGAPDNLDGLFFLDPDFGIAVGRDGGAVRTTDGGDTWSTITTGTVERLEDVIFFDESTGYIVGRENTFLKTTDGGDNWSPVGTSTSGDLKGIHFRTADEGFIAAEDGLYRINADGTVLEQIELGNDTEFNSVYFSDESTGWACGGPGAIYATIDGGDTWGAIDLEGLFVEFSTVYGLGEGAAFAVGDAGTVAFRCEEGSTSSVRNLIAENSMEVLGNPFGTKLAFRWEAQQSGMLTAELYDSQGRKTDVTRTIRSTAGTNYAELSTAELPAGLYFLTLTGPQTRITQKLIKR